MVGNAAIAYVELTIVGSDGEVSRSAVGEEELVGKRRDGGEFKVTTPFHKAERRAFRRAATYFGVVVE